MSKDRIKELAGKIIQARQEYYNEQPKVSDQTFDAWVDELRTLDDRNPALTAIGAPVPQSEWKKAKHHISMGSLDKVNTPDELIDWAKDKNCKSWFVVEKLDGLSIECVYEDGKLISAITRGDGTIGEEINANVRRMQGVSQEIKGFTGSLRGEIIMTKSVHQKYFSDKANPRNAASGVSKRLDGIDVDKLTVLFYQAIGDVDFATEDEQFNWLQKNKIGTPNHWTFANIDQVNEHWRDYQDHKREQLDWCIDGLVVRINNLADQQALGEKDMRPKGSRAYKFDNEMRQSVIRDIIWQVGSSGRICPVAVVDPVVVSGASIERASLYNHAYIKQLGLDIGAEVLVARANEVIPRVEEVVKGTNSIAQPPTNCPECHAVVEIVGEYVQCPNVSDCPAHKIGRLDNWIKELNLLEWGNTLTKKLVETGKVKTVADLYRLTIDDLASIDRMGKKSATKCHTILWANTEIDLPVFLGGLSIPLIGQSTIKAIMNAGYDTFDKIRALSVSQLETVPGVGPSRAGTLVAGINTYGDVIYELFNLGIKIKEKKMGLPLSGKSICLTGKMANKRAVLEQLATDAGADVKGSVNKNLSFLVIANPEKSTSSKAVNARKFGTTLISETDLLKMIGHEELIVAGSVDNDADE